MSDADTPIEDREVEAAPEGVVLDVPGTPPPTQRSWILHPALYIALFVFLWVDGSLISLLPSPPPEATVQARASEEEPVSLADLHVTLLLGGSGMLFIYLVLRAFGVRIFPRGGLPPGERTGGLLLRFGVVFLFIGRVAGALVAVGHWFKGWGWLPGDMPDVSMNMAVANLLAIATCVFVFLLFRASMPAPAAALGLREPKPFRSAAIGIAGYVMLFPLLIVAEMATRIYGPLIGVLPERQTVLTATQDAPLPYVIAFVIGGVVIAAFTEEVLYRGMLYGTLRRYLGPMKSIVISAALFAAMHQMASGFLALFLIGFLMAYLYERTGSLVAPMVAHAANNLLTFAIVLGARAG
ncbi:CPBP family intramembrane metalloprotease [bacterium]|nr:CPBP family intramembrane metalloprotease [bacterium]